MEPQRDNSPQKNVPHLPLQQEALAYGMLHNKGKLLTEYSIDAQRVKTLPHIDLGTNGFNLLVDKFKKDPKDCLAMARENLFSLMEDPKLTRAERSERLGRYLDAYFALQVKLDHQAFPPDNSVHQGIPNYIPDGLSDMGSDPNTEPSFRTREKLRVNKAKVLMQCKDLFINIFSHDFSNIPIAERNDAIKKTIVDQIGKYVYHALPYDYEGQASYEEGHSVLISDFRDMQLAVCRQQALYTQVLLQAFGLTSRYIKTDVTFDVRNLGPHANNLVRLNKKWFVLDVTNPEKLNPQRSAVFMKPVSEREIDLNKNKYTWNFDNGYDKRKYVTRNNMFYRIRDNAKDPLG